MFATGMQTLCTRALGRGDLGTFNRLFSAVMILGTGFSLLMAALLFLAARPFAILLGASGKGALLAAPAAQYLRGIGIGLPALIMTGVLAAAIHMDSGRKRVMRAALICTVMNAVLDLAAIFLHLGLFGIGLATALGWYLQFGLLSLHFLSKKRMLHFVPLRTDWKEMLSLLSCGTEKALRRLGNILRPIVLNKLIIFYGGTLAMTSMSVQTSLSDFSRLFAVGLADAVTLLVGVLFGEKNAEAIDENGRCASRNCIRFCGTVCILFFVFARPIARLYISEEGELLNMTVFAVRMIALEAPLYGLLRLRIAYLQAVNRTRDMQLLSVLSILIYVVLAAAVLGAVFGAYGILAAFPVSDFLSLATVWACCSFKTRKLLPSKSECAVSGNQQRYYLFSNKGTGTEEWMKKGGTVYP
jgi:Na+-driven multidrug efflux pump